mgnify:CR=1 FL=1
MKNRKGYTLLGWAIIFLVIAVVAALLGFGAVAGVSLTIGKWLAIIFIILFVVSAVAHYARRK